MRFQASQSKTPNSTNLAISLFTKSSVITLLPLTVSKSNRVSSKTRQKSITNLPRLSTKMQSLLQTGCRSKTRCSMWAIWVRRSLKKVSWSMICRTIWRSWSMRLSSKATTRASWSWVDCRIGWDSNCGYRFWSTAKICANLCMNEDWMIYEWLCYRLCVE